MLADGEGKPIQLPAWANPMYMSLFSDFTVERVTVPSNDLQSVIGADPTRWAIGFSIPIAPGIGAFLTPYANPAPAFFASLSANSLQWFEMFKFGPIPSLQWYAVNCAGLVLTIHTLTVRV